MGQEAMAGTASTEKCVTKKTLKEMKHAVS